MRAMNVDPGDLHVWRIPLDAAPGPRRALLSPDELERADRFVVERVRAHFTVARAALREILSRYLSIAPEEIRFLYGTQGKPALAHPTLRFNLAHSGTLALLGLMHGRELGVDVEHVRADIDVEGLAGRFFSPGERAQVLAHTAGARVAAFFRCWTRKEAFLKARGVGLAGLHDAFDERFTLLDLDTDAGYAAAACFEGGRPRVRAFTLPG